MHDIPLFGLGFSLLPYFSPRSPRSGVQQPSRASVNRDISCIRGVLCEYTCLASPPLPHSTREHQTRTCTHARTHARTQRLPVSLTTEINKNVSCFPPSLTRPVLFRFVPPSLLVAAPPAIHRCVIPGKGAERGDVALLWTRLRLHGMEVFALLAETWLTIRLFLVAW